MAGHARLNFMDAYKGYHQIAMSPEDMEKTIFISLKGLYYYKVMSLGLKNAGATYQRMVYLMFGELIGDTIEAHVDDMVVKSQIFDQHLAYLADIFTILKKHKLRLNAKKCAFTTVE